jgi:hypothetical protein
MHQVTNDNTEFAPSPRLMRRCNKNRNKNRKRQWLWLWSDCYFLDVELYIGVYCNIILYIQLCQSLRTIETQKDSRTCHGVRYTAIAWTLVPALQTSTCNVPRNVVNHATLWITILQNTTTLIIHAMTPPNNAQSTGNEGDILLAIQAIRLGQILSIRQAVSVYKVLNSTLRRRMNGTRSKRDSFTGK